ncbi:S41 family peptidase [Streptomyces xiamenensis]|uniref:S41 family peptidase n=1 Tax=Streptomyces xiamenensis TaxID=408015 RepID=UPI0035DFCAA0
MTLPFYARFPHVYGELVAFVAEDDVWVAPLSAGGTARARRISTDHAPANHPRISPDGSRVAWTSWRDGTPEIYVAPVDGGPATRLTWWGHPETSVRGWCGPDEVLAISGVGQPDFRWTWARAVPLAGGPARTLPYGSVGAVAYGADGGVLLRSGRMGRGRDASAWKRYRGGAAGKLWIDRTGDGDFERIHADLDGAIEYPLWQGERIAFLSDHEGTGALYSSLPDGTGLRRHTPLGGAYARHAAGDGVRVSYAAHGELWLLDDLEPGTEPYRPDITLGGPRTGRRPHHPAAADHLAAAAPDHTGDASLVETRGTLHLLPHGRGPARALAAEPGVRARLPLITGDRALWITDADGAEALAVRPTGPGADGTAPTLIGAGELGHVLELAASPDGRLAALALLDGRLLLADLDRETVRELDSGPHGPVTGPVFSPDSAWLAWSHPGKEPLRQLRLARLADATVIEATPLRFRDYAPAFTRDGRHLAFLSERSFEPVYDAHVFEVSFPVAARPHLLTLAADIPSPLGPVPPAPALGTHEVQVDPEGLDQRVEPFPVPAGRYSGLCAYDGGVLWLAHPVTGFDGTWISLGEPPEPRQTLHRFPLDGADDATAEEIATGVASATVSGDGRHALLRTGDGLCVLPLTGDGGPERAPDLNRIRLTVDPAAEWRQMYDEAGRLMRLRFWRTDMSGVDYAAQLARYRPLLERIGSHDDLMDVLWEVQGELGTSHAYVIPAAPKPVRPQGWLGADLARGEDGRWRVTRVLPAEPSDPRARSPLAAPGVAVRAGDAVTAVDGRPVDPVTGPAPLLEGTAGRPVHLTVAPADGGPVRHPVVVPLPDEEPLRYHDWVAGRRAEVAERSGGRLGYLHIPDMMEGGWAQLHRDLRLETAREGLVVDVRGNRGGHTSQLVVERLARRVLGWEFPRGRESHTYPAHAPRGPLAVLADEYSGSDGDKINAAVRLLGLGPVIGVRTWGGLIGLGGRPQLADGTGVTQPSFASWLEDGIGFGVENHGVDPDIEVVRRPQDWATGADPQLAEAVRHLLAALAERPASVPPQVPGRAR